MLHVSEQIRAEIQAWLEARRGSDLERDALIRQARAEHGSLREIGNLFGLSHTEVRRILNEKGAKK